MSDQPFDAPVCPFCGGDGSALDHAATCDGRQGRLEALFAAEAVGLVRRADPFTSAEAAASVTVSTRTQLQGEIYTAIRQRGPMSDDVLLALPEFAAYGPSTVRTRRSELAHMGLLRVVGVVRNRRNRKMLVWDVEAQHNSAAL